MRAWYTDHVVPRIVDKACGRADLDELRERVCARLTGTVVEVGFGSGLNLRHYPAAVTRVIAVEPSDVAWRLAAPRVAGSSAPVERAGPDGQRLPLADASVDAALSTWTLCTIPDAHAALRELRRVLVPGGALHFLEHGRAADADVRRWQQRLEPLQRLLFAGCHLTRPIAALVRDAGFTIRELDEFYLPNSPRPFGACSLGVAVPAGARPAGAVPASAAPSS